MYYFAAWTDSGFLLGCSQEHMTVAEAASCILCAGGYVVGVENGAMRSLTAEEESEFQCEHYPPRSDKPPLDIRAAPRQGVPPQLQGETLLEFVLRFLSAHGLDQHAEPISDVKHGSINTNMIDLILSHPKTEEPALHLQN